MINLQPDSLRKKTIHINKVRNEKEVIKDTAEIQRIIRDYYKQLYTNKMDNLEEMEKFLERYSLLSRKKGKKTRKKTENMNRPVMSKNTESVIKNFPTKKSLGSNGFTGEFYQMLKN